MDDGMLAYVDEVLAAHGQERDWDGYGFDFSIICEHGHLIEQDGRCPDGCVSALRLEGLI